MERTQREEGQSGEGRSQRAQQADPGPGASGSHPHRRLPRSQERAPLYCCCYRNVLAGLSQDPGSFHSALPPSVCLQSSQQLGGGLCPGFPKETLRGGYIHFKYGGWIGMASRQHGCTVKEPVEHWYGNNSQEFLTGTALTWLCLLKVHGHTERETRYET